MSKQNKEKQWGAYAPARNTALLRLITRMGISRGRIRKIIARQWWKTGMHFVDSEVNGIRYRLNFRNNTTDEKLLTSSKIYDKVELNALAAVADTENSTFIDIGANTGYYSLSMFKRGFEKILAIEPNPPTLQNLEFNIRANNAGEKIKVAPYCAGFKGEVPFYSNGGLGTASAVARVDESASCAVRALPLVDILELYKIDHIDGLKIDVEGFEDKVLIPFFKNAPIKMLPHVIVIEYCHQQNWRNNVLDIAKSLGYKFERKTKSNIILKGGYSPSLTKLSLRPKTKLATGTLAK